MAVTSIDPVAKAATGHVTSQETTYEAPYRIKVSDPGDGPATIFAYLSAAAAPTPWIGRTFAYGNDTDTSATCREITSPTREKGSHEVWLFSAKYSNKVDGDDQKPDSNGEMTSDPLEWRPEVRITWAQHEKPCYKAKYRGGFTHAPALFTAGEEYAPQNSALEIFDPPMIKDFSRATFSCRMWRQYYNATVAGAIIDVVNNTTETFHSYIPIIGSFAQYTLKVVDVQGNPHREMRQIGGMAVMLEYYEITVEVQYNRDGWREKIVDRGMRRIAQAGDPDGRGGTISLTDLIDGTPPNAAIVGVDGFPLNNPVLLDGAGNPKEATDRTPVIVTWQKYDEQSFTADPYLGAFFGA
jgi:hypothetical protein